MKSILRLLLFSFLALVISCHREAPVDPAPFSPAHKHLLLMHPTVANIRTIDFLITEGIFPLPDNYRIVGVYHESGSYDYALSAAYISGQAPGRFFLHGIGGSLTRGELFSANGLSTEFRWLFEQSEGVLFMGGPDIPPAVYGQATNLLTVIEDLHRHYLELSFLFHLLGGYQDDTFAPLLDERPAYSVLGICLGMQTMNVATGGTMTQDIPTEIYGLATVEEVTSLDPDRQHRNYYSNLNEDPGLVRYSFHRIVPAPESLISRLAFHPGASPYVLSSHHQALKDIGKGFRVTAWCVDSLIPEAFEHTTYKNVTGVQFHPEVINLYRPEARIRFVPGEGEGRSFLDMYPGDMGENFHRSFWKHIALTYPANKPE